MSKLPTSQLQYVIVYDVQRVLYNGQLVSVCSHLPTGLPGFSTLEKAVLARDSMYAYFSKCGQPVAASELVITPVLAAQVVLLEVDKHDVSDDVINVWPVSDKVRGQG